MSEEDRDTAVGVIQSIQAECFGVGTVNDETSAIKNILNLCEPYTPDTIGGSEPCHTLMPPWRDIATVEDRGELVWLSNAEEGWVTLALYRSGRWMVTLNGKFFEQLKKGATHWMPVRRPNPPRPPNV